MNLANSVWGRRLLFAALYFSEGAPIGYIWWAVPSKLKRAGVDDASVTQITALVVLPWAFKFVGAPLVDNLRSRYWGLRAWVVTAQVGMCLSLLPFLFISLSDNLNLTATLLFIHAVMAAFQDISVDTLAIRTVEPAERGSINGWMQTGMLVGRAALGGGALYLGSRLPEWQIVALLIGCIAISLTLLIFSRPTETKWSEASESQGSFFANLQSAFSSSNTWLGIGFALVAGIGFETIGALRGLMMADRGVSEESEGIFMAIPVIAAMAIGAMTGGYLADRWGKRRVLERFLIALTFGGWMLAVVCAQPVGPTNRAIFLPMMGVVYFLLGSFVAASYALFMDLTNPAIGATQFSVFMAATNLCESMSASVGGILAGAVGFGLAILTTSTISVFAIMFLDALHSTNSGEAQSSDTMKQQGAL